MALFFWTLRDLYCAMGYVVGGGRWCCKFALERGESLMVGFRLRSLALLRILGLKMVSLDISLSWNSMLERQSLSNRALIGA